MNLNLKKEARIMKLSKSMTLAGSLCMAMALSSAANMAVAAEAKAPVANAAAAEKVSLLGGHLAFNLKGYEMQPVPGGGPGNMYVSKAEKRVLLIGEDAIPVVARGATDADFIDGMKSIKDKQKQASPDYTVISEKTEKVKGLEVYHIEATDKMDGKDVQQATLLSAADNKFTVIQVISGSKDKVGHAAAVNNILAK
ncbi:hypothetical protein HHI26_01445 [Erwinia sp. JH02]|nr:hypothetical protein [Erwinia rhapontici]NNS05591.1 hypothetical protein [Erwinia sp. JH02]